VRRLRPGLIAVAVATLPRLAWAEPPPRERFLADGDARALAAALGSSADPRDREDAAMAALAADPAARAPAGAPAPARAVSALRDLDLARARAALPREPQAPARADAAFLHAIVRARAGEDEAAARLLLDAPAADDVGSRAGLRLLGLAVPDDDAALLSGVARLGVLRGAALARDDAPARIAASAVAFHPGHAAGVVSVAARALRRAGAPDDARRVLDAAAVPPLSADPDLRLERAFLDRARPGAAPLREPPEDATSAVPRWAFAALARPSDRPTPAEAPPPPLHVDEAEADAAALARCATLLGVPTRTEEVVARAAAARASASDPRFARDWLARVGLDSVELAGSAPAARTALSLGLPVVLYAPHRRGETFRERPFVVRAEDAAAGLLHVEPFDLTLLDVLPAEIPEKTRFLVAAPRARAAELRGLRAGPGAALGRLLFEAAAPGAAPAPLAPGSPPSAALDVHLALAAYPAAVERREPQALADLRAAATRSSAVPPALAFERYVLAIGAPDADAAIERLDEALAAGGDAAWLRLARFVTLAGARRTREALAELSRARALDPLDTRILYFRGSTRRLLGDREGARADLVRVLDRRPATLAAAEDLARLHDEAGRPDLALATVEALERADREAASSDRVRALRRAVEGALVRGAQAPEALRPLLRSPEADTRRRAAVALSSFEAPAAEAALRTLLSDPDEAVRVTTLRGYLRPWLRARLATDVALRDAVERLLVSDGSESVRGAAAGLLGAVDAPAARAAVAARVAGPSRDASGPVRAAAAEALSGRDAPESRAALVAALSDDDVEVRRAAIRSLHRIAATTFDFEPEAPPEARAPRVERWKAWARGE
jgi:hypothetical protein